ncbi:methionine biosynthesis protein MetW [Allorhodopirellula heiligendammensis]|uniref:Homoserine O-acetyltransferase n=1 Tax=Allorhodopirellula heiligendammensis TaxID=2714739 RepID=A0A5C6BVT6_9BACT|nr:homoserine O-acetyltransferase [Allorhodopirellula heiligendammensis]TWU16148.1 Homoserine O-acetyltransferase [Allorhodopirellula heiligendammensis]
MSLNEDCSSTDDIRSDEPLSHAQTVWFNQPLLLERGGQLPKIRCCYETWGTLNADASNAILVCHAVSGDSHAARHNANDQPGWWDGLIGPGMSIDTNQFFVVCPNVLGGCRGTTGPGDLRAEDDLELATSPNQPIPGVSINSDERSPLEAMSRQGGGDERPYGADFPRITIGDMVEVQRRLADHLGIVKWRAIVGGSLGGHQALQWVSRYPNCTHTCIAIATSPRLTSQALGFDVIARNAIQTDPHFHGGQYYDRPNRPVTGLAIARMLGHITYLSVAAMEAKFDPDRHDPRHIASDFEQRFSVGSYLAHQGQKFTTRFDANSYITLSMAMDLFDLGGNRLKLMETFDECTCDFLLVSFSSDWLFPPAQSREIVNALTALDKRVTYAEITSDAGHDAFLIARDMATYGPLVQERLRSSDTHRGVNLSAGDAVSKGQSPVQLTVAEESILEIIPAGSSVLDLGCGCGELLAAIRDRHAGTPMRLMGVEVAQENILSTAMRGLDVIDYDLNNGLPAFIDDQFDVVVLNATLQAVDNVVALLEEMLRVGKKAIISFPNFAYRALREDYVTRGRSPRAVGEFDFDWHDTPNRRFPTIADVHDLLIEMGVTIDREIYWDVSQARHIDADDDPNLNADTAVLEIHRS